MSSRMTHDGIKDFLKAAARKWQKDILTKRTFFSKRDRGIGSYPYRYCSEKDAKYSMAALTASAQLRSSGQPGSATTDELIAFSNKDGWQSEIMRYAISYVATVKEYLFKVYEYIQR